jgi:hypothetical protein
MTIKIREDGRVSPKGVTARIDRSPVRTTTTSAIGGLQRSRRITYRLTSSPKRRIAGASEMTSSHATSVTVSRAAGPSCLRRIQEA